jgi:hypothetical protein
LDPGVRVQGGVRLALDSGVQWTPNPNPKPNGLRALPCKGLSVHKGTATDNVSGVVQGSVPGSLPCPAHATLDTTAHTKPKTLVARLKIMQQGEARFGCGAAPATRPLHNMPPPPSLASTRALQVHPEELPSRSLPFLWFLAPPRATRMTSNSITPWTAFRAAPGSSAASPTRRRNSTSLSIRGVTF